MTTPQYKPEDELRRVCSGDRAPRGGWLSRTPPAPPYKPEVDPYRRRVERVHNTDWWDRERTRLEKQRRIAERLTFAWVAVVTLIVLAMAGERMGLW